MTELRTQGDPSAIPSSTVTSALELLGIGEHGDIVSARIDRHSVTVVRLRRDEDGQMQITEDGDEVATTTSVISIKRGERS